MMNRSNSVPPRRRHAAAAVALGLLSGLALAEVVLRVIPVPAVELHRRGPVTVEDHRRFFIYDPELGWRGRADARGRFAGWEFATEVRLDERGFRNVHSWYAKRPGQYEVLLLGDSITWGYGVEEERRYSDLLEEELAKLGVEVIIRNAAVPGYDTGQELLLYRRLRAVGCPDLVVLGLYANDVRENLSPFQGPYAKPTFRLSQDGVQLAAAPVPMEPGWKGRAIGKDQTAGDWLKRHVRLYALTGWGREVVRQVLVGTASAESLDDPGGVPLTAALLRRLDDDVRADRGRMAVVVLPAMQELTQPGPAASETAAAQSGVDAVLRLREVFRAASGSADSRPLFFRLDGAHWTERAHEIAARHMARWLVEQALLQGPPRECAVSASGDRT